MTRDPRVAGVVFTGSTETARLIERSLAARSGAIATFIAETGGINAMIVDSSALPEQVVLDAVASGFNSAGQRCSALRVLLLQEEIASRVMELLAGHMDELRVGNPAWLATDVGPVIDREALAMLEAHAARVTRGRRLAPPRRRERGSLARAGFSPLWQLRYRDLPRWSARFLGPSCTSSTIVRASLIRWSSSSTAWATA